MTPKRYSLGAIVLHWLIAGALAFQIVFADKLDGPQGADLFARFQLHKSVGITILLLSLARLAWRFGAPRPAPLPGPGWAKALAGAVHAGFYIVMIGAPITGWIIVSTSDIRVDTLLFGTVPWPHLPLPEGFGEPAEIVHENLARFGVGLFVLHIAGALRHQYMLGHPVLSRMLPGGHGKAIGAVLVAIAIIGGGMALGQLADPKAPKSTPAAPPAPPIERPVAVAEPVAPEDAAKEADTAVEDETEEQDTGPRDWTVNPGGSLGFTASWNGEAINGSFARWSADIRFAPDALDRSQVNVDIDLASASTGDSQRDGSLTGSDFFDTARFARATWRSSGFRALGGDRYRADGTLTLRGVSRPVPLTFTLAIDGDRARARGTATIDRTRFGVGQGEFASTDAIAGPVAISFDFRAAARN